MSKTILITGSTDGIGKLAAMRLASEGHTVFIHGRSEAKVRNVIDEITSQTGNKVDGFVADFTEINAVRSMGEEIKQTMGHIDVLVNNAGVYNSSDPVTPSGLDIRFVVNYFAPIVLTDTLMPLIRAVSAPRIINLSSAAQASVVPEVMDGKRHVGAQGAYAQSKLAILMWSFHLAQTEPSISVVALNPGSLLDTNMVREAFGHHWSSADKGANIICDLATDARFGGVTGQYFDNDHGGFGKAHGDAYSDEKLALLMDKTRELLPILS